ncbi:glycosyltransferase family 2 protein [Spiribacter sp. 221]|uniref:glycosyltransferase family 2 protein n=1 Tax=Spiribacter onubensis TaxID=3122420 RepID=UPI00349F0621
MPELSTDRGQALSTDRGQPLSLSVAIITKNESSNLPRLFDSLERLNPREIIVVDSGSTDDTVQIARSHGAHVQVTDWPGHVEQKNRALDVCTQPWILSLDADEPISPELADNLRDLLENGDPNKDGYEISRITWYLGDWLRYIWYPEWRLRLVRNGTARWAGYNPHDRLETAGTVGRIKGDIHHYSYADVEDHFRRSIDYARIGAETLAARGKRFRWHKIVLAPLVRLIRLMVFRQGWRDGWRGWIIAWSSMFSCFLKYAFLYEIQRKEKLTGVSMHNDK